MSTPQEISENVKQAREQALVGNYDDSKVYYAGAIQGIQQLLKMTQEPDKKQKWSQAFSMLNEELELVKGLTTTLASFKEDPSMSARAKARAEETPTVSHDPDVWPPPTPQEPRSRVISMVTVNTISKE